MSDETVTRRLPMVCEQRPTQVEAFHIEKDAHLGDAAAWLVANNIPASVTNATREHGRHVAFSTPSGIQHAEIGDVIVRSAPELFNAMSYTAFRARYMRVLP